MSVMLVLLLAVGGVGYWAASGARQLASFFRHDTLRKLEYSAELNTYQAEAYARALRAIGTDDPQQREAYRAEGREFRTKIDTILKEYDRGIPGDRFRSATLSTISWRPESSTVQYGRRLRDC